jgi:hypothetical protein
VETEEKPIAPPEEVIMTAEQLAAKFGVTLKPQAKNVPAEKKEKKSEKQPSETKEEDQDTEAADEGPENEEDADEEVAEKPGEEPLAEETPPETPKAAEKPAERTHTQAELEAILAHAKAQVKAATEKQLRESPEMKAFTELQAVTGKTPQVLLDEMRAAKVAETASNYGISEEEAKRIVTIEEEHRQLKASMAALQAEQERQNRLATYQASKVKLLSNPLAKRLEQEVDAFTQEGALVGFEEGLRFIIGHKYLSGELKDEMARVTEQRVVADVAKRQAGAVEAPGQGALSSPEGNLSNWDRHFVKAFERYGVTAKGVAKQKTYLKKQGVLKK